jgi:hypothetical protein
MIQIPIQKFMVWFVGLKELVATVTEHVSLCEVSGSQGGEYEDYSLLGYGALTIALMMEAVRPSNCRSTSTTLHGPISQKALIFMFLFLLSFPLSFCSRVLDK